MLNSHSGDLCHGETHIQVEWWVVNTGQLNWLISIFAEARWLDGDLLRNAETGCLDFNRSDKSCARHCWKQMGGHFHKRGFDTDPQGGTCRLCRWAVGERSLNTFNSRNGIVQPVSPFMFLSFKLTISRAIFKERWSTPLHFQERKAIRELVLKWL